MSDGDGGQCERCLGLFADDDLSWWGDNWCGTDPNALHICDECRRRIDTPEDDEPLYYDKPGERFDD